MWATADETRAEIIELYHRAWQHDDETITTLDLDSVGRVPWWPEDSNEVTLHQILVHMTAETHRHAGHADIVRELLDGRVGMRQGNDNMPTADKTWWDDYRNRLEQAAKDSAHRSG